jgi:hypothetical protein
VRAGGLSIPHISWTSRNVWPHTACRSAHVLRSRKCVRWMVQPAHTFPAHCGMVSMGVITYTGCPMCLHIFGTCPDRLVTYQMHMYTWAYAHFHTVQACVIQCLTCWHTCVSCCVWHTSLGTLEICASHMMTPYLPSLCALMTLRPFNVCTYSFVWRSR